MIDRFEIVGSKSPRPPAEKILFCDGTGGSLLQTETDLELSHWRPNLTPAEYRAGTSTEICFRFLDNPRPGSWTVAVNNHVDVDGILSVYTLVQSEHALGHRQTIVQAAEMGDFWGWGEPPAQRLFQGLTRLMNSGVEGKAAYSEAFRRIPAFINGTDEDIPQIEDSLSPLRRGFELCEQGRIIRSLIGDRLVHWIIPWDVAGVDDGRAAYTPEFNEAISEKTVLWPQVRARWDAERACLVSTERETGWFHDLRFPGYLWADTEGLWQPPGMKFHDGMSSYEIRDARLIAAFEALQRREPRAVRWGLGETSSPFGRELQSRFPLVGRVVDERGHPAVSQLKPDDVAAAFEGVFG